MNCPTVCPLCLILAALLTVPGATGRASEPTAWTARPDPSSHSLNWTPKANFALDLRPLGGPAVHPPTLTPFVLVNGTWLNQESPVYDLRTGQIVGRVGKATEQAGAGLYCALSPNGQWVAMARGSRSPTVWSTESGKKVLQLDVQLGVSDIRQIWFADDQRLITFHGQYAVEVWSIPEGKLIVEFDLPRDAYKRAMDTAPGGNYLLVAIEDSPTLEVIAIDLRTGETAGKVAIPRQMQPAGLFALRGPGVTLGKSPIPQRLSYHIYDLDVSFDGAEFACFWSNDDGAFLTAWQMEDGRQTVQHRLGDSWEEFAQRFDLVSGWRSDWNARQLCWKPDCSGWLVSAAIHVERETGDISPILLPEPWFGSQSHGTPRHLPGNHVLNVLRDRPEGLLAVVQYDPTKFPQLRQGMAAGYLPADFGRSTLSVLPAELESPLRQLPESAEAVPTYTPPEIAPTENKMPDRVELEYPAQHGKDGVRDMWQPGECGGDVFVSFGRYSNRDWDRWYLVRYDCGSQEKTGRFTPPFLTRPIDASPSGNTVLTRTDDGRFDLWKFSGEHLLGFRPDWPARGRLYSLSGLPVALLDDQRFLQLNKSREFVLRSLPDGKAAYRIASETGKYVLPEFDRRTLLLFRTFGWDVLDVDSGTITQRITLPENVRGRHHHAVFSPSGKQVALILPIELPERANKSTDSVQGRLSRSLAVVALASGQETMRLSLVQPYKISPLWVSEDYLLIDSLYDGCREPELHTHGDSHLLVHAETGWPVWRFVTRHYQQRVRSGDRLRGVWSTQSADPRIPRVGRLLGQSLLTSEILEAADTQVKANRPLLDRFSKMAVGVAFHVPTELEPLRVTVYQQNSGRHFVASSESMGNHFRCLMEDQGIEVDPNAEHRVSIEISEQSLDKLVEPALFSHLRDDRSSLPVFSGQPNKWLEDRLEKEGSEIHAVQVTCSITLSDSGGNRLASVQRTFDTFDSGLRERGVRDDESIQDRLRKNVWRAAATWCLNQSAQSILTGTFDERQIPTTRLDGGKLEELENNQFLGPPQ